jgi:hypothetical protein
VLVCVLPLGIGKYGYIIFHIKQLLAKYLRVTIGRYLALLA